MTQEIAADGQKVGVLLFITEMAAIIRENAERVIPAHRFAGGAQLIELYQSVSLCATYWHFLLLVWLAVFGMLLLA